LGYIFGSSNEIDWSDQIIAFDLTEIQAQKPVLIPVVNYLLHRIELSLDGSPAIIVLNEAWDLVDNIVIGPVITDFLNRMKQKNCIVIFASQDIDHVGASEISAEIKKSLTTEIFMPNHHIHQCYKSIFGLSDEEAEIVKVMHEEEHHFLFKCAGDSVIASLNPNNFIEFSKILAADEITLAAMEEVIEINSTEENKNPEPQIWLPQLFEILKEVENERVAEEKKKIREQAAAERKRLKEKLEASY
jgi:type IV secretion system protein VirB4